MASHDAKHLSDSDAPASFRLSGDEALELAMRRDATFPVKVACAVVLAVMFYAEQLWRAGTDVVGSLACSFVVPCIAPGSTAGWLWAHFFGRMFLIAGVTWYATYAMAWLSLPGVRFKLAAAVAIVVFPFALLLVAVVLVVVMAKLNLPFEPVIAFEERYLPSWWQ